MTLKFDFPINFCISTFDLLKLNDLSDSLSCHLGPWHYDSFYLLISNELVSVSYFLDEDFSLHFWLQ